MSTELERAAVEAGERRFNTSIPSSTTVPVDGDWEWKALAQSFESLRAERDCLAEALREAVEHLGRLDSWGWGEGAPDDAIRDWKAAREWLVLRPLPGEKGTG